MIMLLFGPTPMLTALQVLPLIVLLGPEAIYQRILELIRAFRSGEPSKSETTPPRPGAGERPI